MNAPADCEIVFIRVYVEITQCSEQCARGVFMFQEMAAGIGDPQRIPSGRREAPEPGGPADGRVDVERAIRHLAELALRAPAPRFVRRDQPIRRVHR
jgi:hypothetical protein